MIRFLPQRLDPQVGCIDPVLRALLSRGGGQRSVQLPADTFSPGQEEILQDAAGFGVLLRRHTQQRRVDSEVYEAGCVAWLSLDDEGPERAAQVVVVPREHRKPAAVFVQVIVVKHGAGIAVVIHDEVVNGKIPEELIGV